MIILNVIFIIFLRFALFIFHLLTTYLISIIIMIEIVSLLIERFSILVRIFIMDLMAGMGWFTF